jgi:hypothetical protein
VGTVRDFDLFRLEPVYAFSRLTSRTGIAWIALFSFSLAVFPIELMNPIVIGTWTLQMLLAVAAFVLPLQVVHRRLVAGKRRLLAEHDQRLKSTLELVHHTVDRQEVDQFGQLDSVMKVLQAERDMLNRLPTWPWRAETLRGFLSAIAAPILLLLVQLALERMLGG